MSIGVLLPIYNASTYLFEALESLRNQTYEDFEVLLLNNGSTDHSEEICHEYSKMDERFIYYDLPVKGMVNALNFGLNETNHQYVARMDADDISHPKRFEKQVDYISQNPKTSILGTQIEIVDSKLQLIKTTNYPCRDNDLKKRLRKGGNVFAHPSVIMDRKKILSIGGYNKVFRYAQDYDLWKRATEECVLANLNDVLLTYRSTATNVSSQAGEEQLFYHVFADFCAHERMKGLRDPSTLMGNAFSIDALTDPMQKVGVSKLQAGFELYRDNRSVSSGKLALTEYELSTLCDFILLNSYILSKKVSFDFLVRIRETSLNRGFIKIADLADLGMREVCNNRYIRAKIGSLARKIRSPFSWPFTRN